MRALRKLPALLTVKVGLPPGPGRAPSRLGPKAGVLTAGLCAHGPSWEVKGRCGCLPTSAGEKKLAARRLSTTGGEGRRQRGAEEEMRGRGPEAAARARGLRAKAQPCQANPGM